MQFPSLSRLPGCRPPSAVFGRWLPLLLPLAFLAAMPGAHADGPLVRRIGHPIVSPGIPVVLTNDVPSPGLLAQAKLIGPVRASASLQIAVTLPLRDDAGRKELLRRLYDPTDPQFHQFLTPAQFYTRFAPTQNDYDTVIAYLKSQGLTVSKTYASRTLVDATGPATTVGSAFKVKLNRFQMADGRIAFANNTAPTVTRQIASVIGGVIGLDNLALRHAHSHITPSSLLYRKPVFKPGSGQLGLYSPSDIKTAYSLTSPTLDGTGQTLALYELDGYTASDVTTYTSNYGLGTPVLKNILVDGFSGTPSSGGGPGEVTLDIELMLALAPRATILVYESANQDPDAIDQFTQIANDNAATSISSSWGISEDLVSTTTVAAESAALQQEAAQGQSFYVAAGDDGAYDDAPFGVNPPKLTVDDPSNNPYSCAVGGTTLTTNTDGSYKSEIVWKGGTTPAEGAGGGGVSSLFTKPDYQALPTPVGFSSTQRDVPDVALNADPATSYSIYYGGAWTGFGGTSCAAPLWAGFTGLVNQQRLLNGYQAPGATLGFPNPPIYALARDATSYARDFHDITVGDNLFYNAGIGFDDATGWGTFIGDNLIADLSPLLQITGPDGTLTGVVTGPNGPVAGATVTAASVQTGKVFGTATTDATGTYTMQIPSLVTYIVSVDAPSEAGEAVGGITVTAAGTTTQNFTLTAGHAFAGDTKYQMISAPYEYSGLANFPTLFGASSPLGATDPLLYNYQPSLQSYIVYPVFPADTLHLGYGYWLVDPGVPVTAGTPPVTTITYPAYYVHRQGTLAATDTSGKYKTFQLNIPAGWNQIGDPFLDAEPLASITADSTASPGSPLPVSSSPLVTAPLYNYSPGFAAGAGNYNQLQSGDSIQPWVGYWIFVTKPTTLSFGAPATSPPPPPVP